MKDRAMPMRRLLVLCVGLLLATVSIGVPSAALATQCSVGGAHLAFGPVDTLSPMGTSASAEVSISCSEVPEGIDKLTVCGHLGPGSGGVSGGVRQMSGGPDALGFGLHTDPAHQVPWGHDSYPELGEPLRVTLDVADGVASTTLTLHGHVYGGQASVGPGSYSASLADAHATFAFDDGDLPDCTNAHSTPTEITVGADVPANCLVETGDLNFGTVGVIDQNLDAIADILVSCTPGTTYSIGLDGGISGATEPDQRQMRAGDRTLTYGLYLDALRSEPWGEGVSVKSGEGSGSQQTIPVYGRVPPQPVAVGSYTDTVVVTITYD